MRFVKNEWIKIWNQRSSWIMLALFLLAIVGFLGLNRYFTDDSSTKEARLAENKEDIELYERFIKEETNQDYIAEYKQTIETIQYRIDNDLISEGTVTVMDGIDLAITISIAITTIFALVVGAAIVSNELGTGTIKMLLTRPAARWKILLSKLVATILYGITLMVAGIVVGIATSYILYDATEPFRIIGENGQFMQQTVEFHFANTLLYSAASMLMTILFAFMLGTVFSSSTLAVSLALGIMFFGSMITMYMSQYDFTKYIWFANDLSQYAIGNTPMLDVSFTHALIVNIVYAVIFLGAAFTYFIRRDITA